MFNRGRPPGRKEFSEASDPRGHSTDRQAGVQCPNCGSVNSAVYDSRGTTVSIRRRRECKGCGARFTTYEIEENIMYSLYDSTVSLQMEVKTIILGKVRRYKMTEIEGED